MAFLLIFVPTLCDAICIAGKLNKGSTTMATHSSNATNASTATPASNMTSSTTAASATNATTSAESSARVGANSTEEAVGSGATPTEEVATVVTTTAVATTTTEVVNFTEDLLQKVADGQVALLDRLALVDAALNATLERAQRDLQVGNSSDQAVADLNERADFANVTSEATLQSIIHAKADKVLTDTMANETFSSLDEVKLEVERAEANTASAGDLRSISHQIDDNQLLLEKLAPRLSQLRVHMGALDARLQQGNVSEVVEDVAKRSFSDVLRDMGRGLYRLLPD